ncbi:SBBP repeat-containing protein [Xanthomarina sp. F2636L]|uniref:SBBP repeat-containing protein n=1 Tax=Xanthomarina sp. F2636L TaxID=2996018 RepID=UPI00225E0734|nr:SBBP repeat-containing protein [Xanthomarina sp. F2636L]MCX7550288.1 SBBP repeat-containing protein [Xanthomarina sp. F2636L]
MKINLKALIFTTFFLGFNTIYSQSLEWAKSFGETNIDVGYSIAVDASGNVYTTGLFQGTVDFDPGTGISNLTASGYEGIFVQKLDANGNFQWAKSFGGSSTSNIGYSIALDTSNNIYITGEFNGNVFVQKMDSNGNILWENFLESSLICIGFSIVVDTSGNVYTTGYFQGTVDFDPGTGISNLTAYGTRGVFVQKLDTNGSFLWAKSFGGSGYSEGKSITLDISGNVYTTGYFRGSGDFDPGSGISILTGGNGYDDVFVQKMDANGNFLWAKSLTGDDHEGGSSIITDASGNVYTTGYFEGIVDFDPGTSISNLTASGSRDVFVQKMDANGDFLWAKSFGGTDQDGSTSIAIGASGDLYLIGYFYGTVDFDPGTGINNLTSGGAGDVFVQKMDTNGNFLWVKSFGGVNSDSGISIALDTSENLYTVGAFSGTADFDPDLGTNDLTSLGNYDVFVQKMSQSNLGVQEISNNIKVIAYPNPSEGIININFSRTVNNVQFIITDVLGKILKIQTYSSLTKEILELPNTKGIYFLTIKTQNSQKIMRIVKK